MSTQATRNSLLICLALFGMFVILGLLGQQMKLDQIHAKREADREQTKTSHSIPPNYSPGPDTLQSLEDY